MIVVDVNIVAYFFIEGDKTGQARELRGSDSNWLLPPLWRHEFLNVLATFVREGGASIDDAQMLYHDSVELLKDAERDVDMPAALRLASSVRISAYDAQYIVLAAALDTVCVTEDRRLQRIFAGTAFGMQDFLAKGSLDR